MPLDGFPGPVSRFLHPRVSRLVAIDTHRAGFADRYRDGSRWRGSSPIHPERRMVHAEHSWPGFSGSPCRDQPRMGCIARRHTRTISRGHFPAWSQGGQAAVIRLGNGLVSLHRCIVAASRSGLHCMHCSCNSLHATTATLQRPSGTQPPGPGIRVTCSGLSQVAGAREGRVRQTGGGSGELRSMSKWLSCQELRSRWSEFATSPLPPGGAVRPAPTLPEEVPT
jgi:hypothetical protein